MKSKQGDDIIARLERCRDKNKEFYKRHTDLLEELNCKINALKNGANYEIKDAGWVVGYVGGKIRDTNLSFNEGKAKAIEQIAKAEAEAIMKVNQAIIESGTDERVIALKQVEALKEMANNPANKLILPNETLSSLGSIAAIGEMLKDSKTN